MSQSEVPGAACTSGANGACPFSGTMGAHIHDGRFYCQFHAPLAAAFKASAEDMPNLVNTVLVRGIQDFTGTVFPGGPQFARFTGAVTARRCTFADGAVVGIMGSVDFSGSMAQGKLTLRVYP